MSPDLGGAAAQRPNIIFIVADDLGFADLGCYGGRAARFGAVSPVLDRLAGNGLKLTQGYANSPVCSPTRFALMTARYQYRLRGAAEQPINSKSRGSTTLGLPPEHPTLPSLLRAGGYRTALMGKWHLGYLFDLSADERERANLAAKLPDRLAAMRGDWEAWNATMPPIPEDATVSLGYSAKDMPQR